MKYYSNINLNQNEIENAVIHVVSSDGEILSPVAGQVIFDDSSNTFKYYDGAAWVASNALSIDIAGDTGSATLNSGETLTFVGGTNLNSVVASGDSVTFNLDDSITIASDLTVFYADITTVDASTVNSTNVNSSTVTATDVNSVTVDAHTVNATDVNSVTVDTGTINATTVNSTDVNVVTVNANEVNATDVFVDSIIGNSASIGPLVVNSGIYPSDVAVTGDLIVTGKIVGNVASSDITGTLFSIVAGVASPFTVTPLETVTFAGTSNEIAVTSSGDNNVTIGIASNPTLSGNVTVTGNLTVNGTTTTVNSQTLTVKDPIVQLNTGIGTTNTNDLGLILTRGSDDGGNVGLIWDEQTDQFGLIYTNSDASDVTVDVTSYAKLQTGTLVASSDVTIGQKITSYAGSAPNDGQILIGGSTGFSRGYITGASDTGVVVTSSTDSIVVSINIDGATDGTGSTVYASDLLLISNGDSEQKINVSQLGDLFVRYDINNQTLSATDQIFARTNISAAEVITSTFTGTGSQITRYFPHNLGNKNVLVQIFDNNDIQVYADVNTSNANYCSVTGNFENSITYTVRIMGTRGTPLTVTSLTTAP